MATTIASTSLSARQGYAPARVSARAGAKPAVATRAPLRVVAGDSRIGKHPVPVPKGVTYTLKDNHLAVKAMLYDEHYDDYPDSFLVRMNRREGQHLRARVPARCPLSIGF